MPSSLDRDVAGGDQGKSRLNRAEQRAIFREMAAMELGSGRMGALRRQRLLSYARKIGLEVVDARLILAELEMEAGTRPVPTFDTTASFDLLSRPDDWPTWFKVSFALIVATIIDLILIRVFFE